MPTNAPEAIGTIVPTLRYRDVPAAIDWLCEAFGFRTQVVESDANGDVRYAQLTFGDGMVVLGPVEDSAADGLMVQPGEMGGHETQLCYVFAEDTRALCARAREAGATPLSDAGEPGSTNEIYSFRDPEGHIWNFGSYDPWRRTLRARRGAALRGRAESAAVLAGLVALAIASTALLGWAYHAAENLAALAFAGSPSAGEVRALRTEPVQEPGGRDVGDGQDAGEILARERDGKRLAERVAREALSAQSSSVLAASRAQEQLGAAERAAALASRELLAEQGRRQAAEQSIGAIREELGRERKAREAAELATKQAMARKPKAWRLKKVETPWGW